VTVEANLIPISVDRPTHGAVDLMALDAVAVWTVKSADCFHAVLFSLLDFKVSVF
jgi:hypothetical protein